MKTVTFTLASTILCGWIASTAYADINWQRDDTAKLNTHIQEIFAGTRTRLDAGTYWVRGQIRIFPAAAASSSADLRLYNIPRPTALNENSVRMTKIWGALPDATGLPTTRIVHGVVAHGSDRVEDGVSRTKDWKDYAQLPVDDPWKLRFPASSQSLIKWLDIPVGQHQYVHRSMSAYAGCQGSTNPLPHLATQLGLQQGAKLSLCRVSRVIRLFPELT